MTHRTVILFLCHTASPAAAAEYESIRHTCDDRYEVLFFFDDTEENYDDTNFATPPKTFRFHHDEIFGLGYPVKGVDREYHPGNQDLTILSFYDRDPGYDYYWLIEHDVRFSGDWRLFFDAFEESRSDLLGTSLRDHADDPDWYFWDTLRVPDHVEVAPHHEVIGFFPVLRLSRRALKALHKAYLQGFSGHFEAAMPTIMRLTGLTIEDVGGQGPYVAPANKGRFYTNNPLHWLLSPGSFVFRPSRSEAGSEPDLLWHPVKSARDRTWYPAEVAPDETRKHPRWTAAWQKIIDHGRRFLGRRQSGADKRSAL